MRGWGVGAFVLMCVACGGDGGGAADATVTVVDAAVVVPDAEVVPPDWVVVVVREGGAGVPNVNVLLHDEGGVAFAEELTSEDGGVAFFDVQPGSMVTVLRLVGDELQAFTVVAVEPGDTIMIEDGATDFEPATVDVRVEFAGGYDGTDRYEADLGCAAFARTDPDAVVMETVGESCVGADGDFDVLGIAGFGSMPMAFAGARDVPRAASGATDIPLGAWAMREGREITIANLAPDVTATEIELRPVLGGMARAPAVVWGGAFMVPPSSMVDGWTVDASASAVAGAETRSWAWRQVLPANAPAVSAIDFADLGPRVESHAIDIGNPVRPVVSWVTSAPTTDLSALVVVATWQDSLVSPSAHRWTFVLPPGTDTLQFPHLFAHVSHHGPQATADYETVRILGFFYERHADYAAFRNDRPFALDEAFDDVRAEESRMLFYETQAPN